MKVTYLHHFPYRHLPDDFSTKYNESVVTNPFFDLVDPKLVQADLRNALDEAMYAARAGFDAIAMPEHSQSSYDMNPNPDLGAAALAYATEIEGLETGIYTLGRSLGKSREPLRVAEEQAWLDCLSGGRLISGFPIGLAYDANINGGIPPIETRSRYDENLEFILKAWTERKPFPWNGKYSQHMCVNIWPRPVQSPHPPVNITGVGNPNTARFALERDMGFNLVVFGKAPNAAQRNFDDLWRMAAELGLDDNPFRAAFSVFVCVGKTDAEAERLYASHVEYFMGKGIAFFLPQRFALPGGISPTGLRALLREMPSGKKGGPPRYCDLVEAGIIIAGSPATVRDRLMSLARSFRIGNLLAELQLGSMPPELTRYNIDLFSTEVLPHLRPIWSEYAAKNRWWPVRLGGQPVSPKQADSTAARLK
jgi:alkanesulfonate monooxygenase SsuD/methylene tetrahydromethanopterin reductase-like flavin-dependent oxidoreductase (luciferase family)